MDSNNTGMNPIVNGGVDKKQMYIWIGIIILILVIIGLWMFMGKSKPVNEEVVPTNNVVAPITQPLNTKTTNTSTTSPELNFDIKG